MIEGELKIRAGHTRGPYWDDGGCYYQVLKECVLRVIGEHDFVPDTFIEFDKVLEWVRVPAEDQPKERDLMRILQLQSRIEAMEDRDAALKNALRHFRGVLRNLE